MRLLRAVIAKVKTTVPVQYPTICTPLQYGRYPPPPQKKKYATQRSVRTGYCEQKLFEITTNKSKYCKTAAGCRAMGVGACVRARVVDVWIIVTWPTLCNKHTLGFEQ